VRIDNDNSACRDDSTGYCSAGSYDSQALASGHDAPSVFNLPVLV
jgi:hypothetical protein